MTKPSTTPPVPITLTMPLEDAMRTQRAIRRLRPDPVDDALVLRLIELALRAPSGGNAQNWEFVVGLGAALITLPIWSTVLARRALGLPWRTPCAVVPLGWPHGRYGPTTRRPVGDVVHVDRWGNQPFRGQHAPR